MSEELEKKLTLQEQLNTVLDGIQCSIVSKVFIQLVDDLTSTGSDPTAHHIVRQWLLMRRNL